MGAAGVELFDLKDPDDPAEGFSAGRWPYDFSSLMDVCLASRNAYSHTGKFQAARVTDLREPVEALLGDDVTPPTVMLHVAGR